MYLITFVSYFSWYGVQTCSCGTQFGEHGTASSCSLDCDGNCGGYGAQFIYRHGGNLLHKTALCLSLIPFYVALSLLNHLTLSLSLCLTHSLSRSLALALISPLTFSLSTIDPRVMVCISSSQTPFNNSFCVF